MAYERAPFLKWAGGKRRLVSVIAGHLNLPVRRLVEPFAGGAAVGLALADHADGVWLNDINMDLINLYAQLGKAPEQFIADAAGLFTPETNTAAAYYRLRGRFNETPSAWDKALLFLYLNRHSFNGLVRYNADGGFNVPFGRYKRPYFPENELRGAAPVLQRARLTSLDFEAVLAECGPGDAVYCDPPYVPLSETASFTDYAAGGFTMADHERLVAAAQGAQARGALVVISNHDTPATRQLYAEAVRHYVDVQRMISRDGDNRGAVGEVVAVFAPGPSAPFG